MVLPTKGHAASGRRDAKRPELPARGVKGQMSRAARWAVITVVAFFPLCARAQTWRPLGPPGGNVFALAMDSHNPKTIYLGCADGHIFVSHDAGDQWQIIGRAGPSRNAVVSSLVVDAADSQRLYASTWTRELHGEGGGVFRSTDAGVHWAASGLEGHAVRALAQASSDPHELVAGALDGVFLSLDSGVSWKRISPASDAELHNIDSIAIDPKNPQVIYAGTFHLPWKTTDAGAHWVPIHSGMIDDSDVFSLLVDRENPSRVFASACSGIYRSENGGASWTKIQGIPFSARRTHIVLQEPSRPKIVYAGTTEGLWKTADGGSSWTLMTPANWVINSMVVEPGSGRVVIGTDQLGVLVSDDGGELFRVSNDGFNHRQITALAEDPRQPGHLFAILANAPETMMETDDNGRTWFPLGGKLTSDDVSAAYGSPRGWLVMLKKGGLALYSAKLRLWRELGHIGAANGAAFKAITNDLAFAGPRWFAATSGGLFVSTDGGETWTGMRLGKTNLPAEAVVASPNGRTLWVVSSGGMLYSSDSGSSWTWKDLPIQSSGVIGLKSGGRGLLLAFSERGVYISRDAGEKWTLAAHGLPASAPLDIAVDGSVWLAAMHDGGIYISRDAGNTWKRAADTFANGLFPIVLSDQTQNDVYAASATEGVYLFSEPRAGAAKTSQPAAVFQP